MPEYRFSIVLFLLFATFAFLASGPTGNSGRSSPSICGWLATRRLTRNDYL